MMGINKIINSMRNHLMGLDLSSNEEDKRNHLDGMKQAVEDLSDEYQKLQETQDLIISQLKQEISRLNRL